MRIEPIRAEPVKEYDGTIEKAISNGLEDAMKDKGRECDYQFNIKKHKGVKYILCEVKLDNGYFIPYKKRRNDSVDLRRIERDAYKFLLEKL